MYAPFSTAALNFATQIVYPASLLQTATKNASSFTINQLQFPYNLFGKEVTAKLNVSVYYAKTSDVNLPLKAADMTKVFSGEVNFADFTDHVLRINVSPIEMAQGENLVLGFITVNQADGTQLDGYNMPLFQTVSDTGGRYMSINPMFTTAAVTFNDLVKSNITVPGMSIEYTSNGGSVDKTDLSVTSITGPTAEADVENDVTFDVNVKNEGTVAVEAGKYKIELLSVSGEESTVLKSYDGTEAIAAGATVKASLAYKFAGAGTYNVAARVVTEGDENADNNTSGTIEVKVVDSGVGVESVSAESLSYNAGLLTVAANGHLVVTDLAGRVVESRDVVAGDVIALGLGARGVYVATLAGKSIKLVF